MKVRSARLGFSVVVALVLALVALPAFAAHTSPHAAAEITALATQAALDMDTRVVAYGSEIQGLQTLGEVLIAEADAEADIFAIWSTAKNAIEDLAQMYPGLGSVAGKAKQQILQKRSQSLAAISDLTAAWVPAGTTTTTTQAPTTTTTPGNSSTTTRPHGNSTTTTTPGNSSTTTKPHGKTTTTTTTTTTIGGSVVVPRPPGNGEGGGKPPIGPGDAGSTPLNTAQATVVAQSPVQIPDYDTVTLSESAASEDNDVTQQMSAALETVLPPAAVDLVLSPLLILEILLRTSLTGGEGILVPLLSLAVCAVLISLTDRFSRRVPRASDPTPHNAR